MASVDFVCFETENAEFAWIKINQTQEDAKTTCGGLNSSLARISNNATFFYVFNKILNVAPENSTSQKTWIGIERFRTRPFGNDTNDFFYVDSFPDRSFFNVGAGNFPWSGAEPNGFNNDSFCVDWRYPIQDAQPWGDFQCGTSNYVLCRRDSCPTSSPTRSPTSSQTDSPVSAISSSPTTLPPSSHSISPVSDISFSPTMSPNKIIDSNIDDAQSLGPSPTVLLLGLSALLLILSLLFSLIYNHERLSVKKLAKQLEDNDRGESDIVDHYETSQGGVNTRTAHISKSSTKLKKTFDAPIVASETFIKQKSKRAFCLPEGEAIPEAEPLTEMPVSVVDGATSTHASARLSLESGGENRRTYKVDSVSDLDL